MPDNSNVQTILATDCGSTTTKAILIERQGDVYRQTTRGEAPTTVEAPFDDVTVGVSNAAREIQELSGYTILDEDGKVITPEAARRQRRRSVPQHVVGGRRLADDGRGRGQGHERRVGPAGGPGRGRDHHGRHRRGRRAQGVPEGRAHPRPAPRHDPDVRRHGRRHGHAPDRDGRNAALRRPQAAPGHRPEAAGHLRRQRRGP